MPDDFAQNFSSLANSNSDPQGSPTDNQFAPPPPNVFVRTSEKDLQQMKTEGGNISNFPTSSPSSGVGSVKEPSSPPQQVPSPGAAAPPTPSITPSSSPETSPELSPEPSFPSKPSISQSPTPEVNPEISFKPQQPPSPPGIIPEGGTTEIPSFPQPETPRRNKFLPLLMIGVLIIGGAALGYFVLWPKIFHPQTPVVVTTTTITTTTTTTTTLPPSPYTSISSPYLKAPVNVSPQGEFVVQAIKETALADQPPAGSFKVLVPKVHDSPLTNEEVILSLIPRLPQRLKPVVLGRPFLVFAYYGEVNPSLGLIVDIGTENKELAQSVFLSWEKRLNILRDMENLYLIPLPRKQGKSFKETENLGATIRTFDYKGKETDFAYAFFDKYLILCSSEEGLNSALEHLQGNLEKIYP